MSLRPVTSNERNCSFQQGQNCLWKSGQDQGDETQTLEQQRGLMMALRLRSMMMTMGKGACSAVAGTLSATTAASAVGRGHRSLATAARLCEIPTRSSSAFIHADTPQKLSDIVQSMRGSPAIALDTEFSSFPSYDPQVGVCVCVCV